MDGTMKKRKSVLVILAVCLSAAVLCVIVFSGKAEAAAGDTPYTLYNLADPGMWIKDHRQIAYSGQQATFQAGIRTDSEQQVDFIYMLDFDMKLSSAAPTNAYFHLGLLNFAPGAIGGSYYMYALRLSYNNVLLFTKAPSGPYLAVSSSGNFDKVVKPGGNPANGLWDGNTYNYKIYVSYDPATNAVSIDVDIDHVRVLYYRFDGEPANFKDRSGTLIAAADIPMGDRAVIRLESVGGDATITPRTATETAFDISDTRNWGSYTGSNSLTFDTTEKTLTVPAGIPALGRRMMIDYDAGFIGNFSVGQDANMLYVALKQAPVLGKAPDGTYFSNTQYTNTGSPADIYYLYADKTSAQLIRRAGTATDVLVYTAFNAAADSAKEWDTAADALGAAVGTSYADGLTRKFEFEVRLTGDKRNFTFLIRINGQTVIWYDTTGKTTTYNGTTPLAGGTDFVTAATTGQNMANSVFQVHPVASGYVLKNLSCKQYEDTPEYTALSAHSRGLLDYQLWEDADKPSDSQFTNHDMAQSVLVTGSGTPNTGSVRTGSAVVIPSSVASLSFLQSASKAQNYRMVFDLYSTAAVSGYDYMLKVNTPHNLGTTVGYYFLIGTGGIELRMPSTATGFINCVVLPITPAGKLSFEVEVYKKTVGDIKTMVINIAINGNAMQFIDRSDRALDTEDLIDTISEPGIQLRTTAGRETAIVSQLTADNVNATFQADDSSLYALTDGGSTRLEDARIIFGSGGIYGTEKVKNVSTDIDLKLSDSAAPIAGKLFSAALRYQTANPAADLFDGADTSQGVYVNLYVDELEIVSPAGTVNKPIAVTVNEYAKLQVSICSVGTTAVISAAYGDVCLTVIDAAAINAEGYIQFKAVEGATIRSKLRVLFIGNSITQHGPLSESGVTIWPFNWGMAVPKEELDYVHLVMADIMSNPDYANAEMLRINAAAWERTYWSYDIYANFSSYASFNPNLIIVKLGENAQSINESDQKQHPFDTYLGKLIDLVRGTKNPGIVLATSYWGTGSKTTEGVIDGKIIRYARANNLPIVRLGDLGSTDQAVNHARADAQYYAGLGAYDGEQTYADVYAKFTQGVLDHPGVNGMAQIAARLLPSVRDMLNGGTGIVNPFYTDTATGIEAEGEKGTLTAFTASEISRSCADFNTAYATAVNKKLLYKLYNLAITGDTYNIKIPVESFLARTGISVYTLSAYDAVPVMLSENDYELNTATNYPAIVIGAQVNGLIAVYVDYDQIDMFHIAGGTARLDNPIDAQLADYAERDSESFKVDLSFAETVNAFTIGSNAYSYLISTGKDIEIVFGANRSFKVDARTFAAMANRISDLYFAIINAESARLTYADTIASAFDMTLQAGTAFNIFIRENGSSGTPIVMNSGVTVTLPLAISTADAQKLVTFSAELPPLAGFSPSYIVNEGKGYITADGVKATFAPKDFGKTYFLVSALSEIRVVANSKAKYKVGETFHIPSLTVSEVYENGETKPVTVTADMIGGFNSAAAGSVGMTLTVRGKQVSFDVTIIDVKAIEIAAKPSKTAYNVGENLDAAGLKIHLVYTDDSKEELAVTADMLGGFDPAKTGKQTVTVTYNGMTASFDVEVAKDDLGGGCGSALADLSAVMLAILSAALLLIVKRKA
jgi:hypothetical protein